MSDPYCPSEEEMLAAWTDYYISENDLDLDDRATETFYRFIEKIKDEVREDV